MLCTSICYYIQYYTFQSHFSLFLTLFSRTYNTVCHYDTKLFSLSGYVKVFPLLL